MNAIIIYIELIIVLALIMINGIFAMAEIAIVSSRRVKIEKKVKEGDKRGKAVLELMDDPNIFLSTIQIGITLIGILNGAFGGVSFAYLIEPYLGFLGTYSYSISIIIVVLVITYITLIFGELVPKKIGLNYPERVAIKLARPMKLLAKITGPISSFLSISMDLVFKLTRIPESSKTNATEDEIKFLIEEGIKTGEIEKSEKDIIKRVFLLDDNKISSLMTPRKDIIWLDTESSDLEIIKTITASKKSIFPVGEKSLDDFLGVVQLKDLYNSYVKYGEIKLKENIKEPLLAPESLDILEVLDLFREPGNKIPIVIVIDEYGSVEGLSTMNNILEAVIGEIPAVNDLDEPMIKNRTDSSWLVDPSITIEDFKSYFNIEELPDEEEGGFNTLGGFAMDYLAKVPELGTKFIWNNYTFEIVDMDGYHIDKILLSKINKKEK